MLRDAYGLPVAAAYHITVDQLNAATDMALGFRGEPVAALDQALVEEPDFTLGWALRGAMLAMTGDAAYAEEVLRSVQAAEAGWDKATDRERAHLGAVQALLEGDLPEATARWGRIAQEHPRDLLALQFAHTGDFYLGQQSELRDRPAQAARAFRRGERGAGYIDGMLAFGLCETGAYDRAFEAGQRAVAVNPIDAWAVHAIAHVHEMRGETAAGMAFLTERQGEWADCNGLSMHTWWHLALYHLDAGDHAAALRLYDAYVAKPEGAMMMDLADASALLWRLHLLGVDVGPRADALADAWDGRANQGAFVFNELHAAMALAIAGRTAALGEIVEGAQARAAGEDFGGTLFREVGVQLIGGVQAFVEERYGDAADALASVRGRALRMGGSNAQRDVVSLTLLEAAHRAGRMEQAAALVAERLFHKPESRWNLALAARSEPAAAMAA